MTSLPLSFHLEPVSKFNMANANSNVHLWLRDETKPFEKRAALTPQAALVLTQAGYRVSVESSEIRIFSDEEYLKSNCQLVAPGSWRNAPLGTFILGLKELPQEDFPLVHTHIYFAHAYKKQKNWQTLLLRFKAGKGLLLDLEYLTDESGRRIAAFGKWAGFAGAALGVDLWAHQQLFANQQLPYPPLLTFSSQQTWINQVKTKLGKALEKMGRSPKTLVIGANGRCGSGALDFLTQVGLKTNTITKWDVAETSVGGPFDAILAHDILINCVLVQGAVNPFLTELLLDRARLLSVIADVSCDPTSPVNPLPIYQKTTTFEKPVIRLREASSQKPVLDLIAIDHLPSLLPRESSEDFSVQLLPHLLALQAGSSVWERAKKLFYEMTNT